MSLTDIARAKNPDEPKDVVKNWLRSRQTIEFLGLWESINNPNFKGVEFDSFRQEAGLNSFTYANEADLLNMALFGKTAKIWREENPNMEGNIRDYASVEQLVVLANMESYNAEMIKQAQAPQERLEKLNAMAIGQLQVLVKSKQLTSLSTK